MIEIPATKFVLPFMMAVAGPALTGSEVNKMRVLEAVIIAVVSGFVIAMAGYYVAFPVMQEQVAQMRREGLETRQLIREIREESNASSLRRDAKEALVEAKLIQLQIELAKMHR